MTTASFPVGQDVSPTPPPQPMTFGQIEALWIANGGDPLWAPEMAGIAMVESSGNPAAWNQNAATGDNSVGLWQINYFGSLAPGRTAQFGPPDQLVQDPNAQARAAIAILGGGPGITAWKSDVVGAAGQSGQPMSLATVQSLVQSNGQTVADAWDSTTSTVDAQTLGVHWPSWLKPPTGFFPGIPWPSGGIGGAVSGLESVGRLFSDLTSPEFWKRVLEGALGVVLFVVGLSIFFASTDTGKKAIAEGEQAAVVAAMA